jgi:hypothetical protein
MEDIGLWVSPVVLVSGVGLLILSTSARYGQIHAELRELTNDTQAGKYSDDTADMLHHHLHVRTELLLSALFALYLSIGLLVTGSLVGAISALWSLTAIPVIVLTCAGILGVVFAAMQLIRESRIFLHSVHVCTDEYTRSSDHQKRG